MLELIKDIYRDLPEILAEQGFCNVSKITTSPRSKLYDIVIQAAQDAGIDVPDIVVLADEIQPTKYPYPTNACLLKLECGTVMVITNHLLDTIRAQGLDDFSIRTADFLEQIFLRSKNDLKFEKILGTKDLAFFDRNAAPELWEIIDNVATKLGLNPPKNLCLFNPSEREAPNAIAANQTIALSNSLLAILNPKELNAVIGHELKQLEQIEDPIHNSIKNGLNRFQSILLKASTLLTGIGVYSAVENRGSLLQITIGALATFATSICTSYAQNSLAKFEEEEADRAGAIAESPNVMISAIEKVTIEQPKVQGFLGRLFSQHEDIDTRTAKIR